MSKATAASTRDLWTEEGDEFFGHSGPAQSGPQDIGKEAEEGTGTPKPARGGGKRHKASTATGSRSRKSAASMKDGSRRKSAIENGDVAPTQ